MGRQMKGSLYFFITDIRYSLMIFWTILLSILIVTLTIAYFLLSVDSGFMTFSLTGPMYIYCAILGFLTVKEAIPFAIKMGATRKNVFISLGVFFLALSFVMAIAASALQELTFVFSNMAGIDNFEFLHLAYFMDDTWYTRILIDTSIMFFFLAFMFIVGLLFYKYGLAGGGSFLGVLAVIVLVGIAQGWLIDFFIDLFSAIDPVFFYQMLAVAVMIYCISFLLLRRITIVKVK